MSEPTLETVDQYQAHEPTDHDTPELSNPNDLLTIFDDEDCMEPLMEDMTPESILPVSPHCPEDMEHMLPPQVD